MPKKDFIHIGLDKEQKNSYSHSSYGRAFFQTVLKDPIPMLAVTGMIAMELNKDSLKIDKELLHSRAFELLQKDIPTCAKVTLIQICGMNQVKPDQVRPILRDILKNSKETQLKVSAIAALGEYGNRDDLEIIEPYCKSSDVRLRTAANKVKIFFNLTPNKI